MVYTLLLAGVLLGVMASGGTDQSTEKSTTNKVCKLTVSGMACSACAATVESVAKKIDGVTKATADQPKGVAEITYDPAKTTPDAIAKRISQATSFKAVVQKEKEKK